MLKVLFLLLFFSSCKSSSVIRSAQSASPQFGYNCNGVMVASQALCTDGTNNFTPTSMPLSYRGVIGKNNNTISKSYWGAYDTGILHAIYDHNRSNTTNFNDKQNIAMIGWAVAAKSSAGKFVNLSTQTVANTDSNIGTSSGTSSWVDMDSNYHPLVQGSNIIKYYDDSDTGLNYAGTTTASLITAYTPTTANDDHNKLYTAIGVSNEKIHNQVLADSYSASQIRDVFNSMAGVSNLFLYDFTTHFVNDAPKVKEGIFTGTYSFFNQNSNDKVLVLPLGNGVKNSAGDIYTAKSEIYLNNVAYTNGGYTSFATQTIPTTYLDRSQFSLFEPSKSIPVVGIPVVNYGDFTNNKLTYYIPENNYNAGALKNIALSVATSPNSITYYYDSTGKIRTTMAGLQTGYSTTSGAMLNPDRQASAILTALIGDYMSSANVTANAALRTLAFQSTPMYGTSFTYTSGVLPTVTQTHGTGTFKEYFRPNLIEVDKTNIGNLVANISGNVSDQINKNGSLTSSSTTAEIGAEITKITSHDILVKDGTNIIAMNDIYIGKEVIISYDDNKNAIKKTVTSITQNTSNTVHDKDGNQATYTGYYFCVDNESTCISPYRRIASNTFGFGLANYRMMTDIVGLETIVRSTNSSSIAPVNLTEIVTSSVFGGSLSSHNLAVNIIGSNFIGETWSDTRNLNERITNIQSSIFNPLLVSSAYLSQNNIKSYNLPIGLSDVKFNISQSNIFGNDDLLSNSRFEGMNLNSSIRNKYGVLLTENSSNDINNIGYRTNISGFDFVVRSNFRPGFSFDSNTSNSNVGYSQRTSVDFNPFNAMVSNNLNSHAVSFGKNIYGTKFNISTIVGKMNFNGQNLNRMIQTPPSQNISHTIGIEKSFNKNKISFDAGILRESSTLLGSYSSGALFLGNSNHTSFAKIHFKQNIFGNISFIGSFALGKTTVGNNSGSLFSNFTPLVSRSFIAGLESEIFGGNINITYSQPLAIISGYTSFTGVNGIQKISLSPSHQEQDYSISFNKQNKNSLFSVQTSYITNQNNLSIPPSFGGFISIRKSF